jgi:two-component sensor histidine kinase
MVSLSQRSARTAEEMATNVRGRLQALASAHELTLPAWSSQADMGVKTTTLKTLLNAIVAPHAGLDPEKERVVFDGPDVPVAGKAVTSLALLLHEFTTNAAKYGALSSPTGRVAVRSAVDEHRILLIWDEQGGPPIDAGAKAEGFGSMLARQTVTGQFGGSISQRWRPDGLTIELSLVPDLLLR